MEWTTAQATATAGDDYALGNGILTIPAGATTARSPSTSPATPLHEPDETFIVHLTAPVNATIADDTGIATITNDDTAPTLTVGDVATIEGDTGTNPSTFTVALSEPSGTATSVRMGNRASHRHRRRRLHRRFRHPHHPRWHDEPHDHRRRHRRHALRTRRNVHPQPHHRQRHHHRRHRDRHHHQRRPGSVKRN